MKSASTHNRKKYKKKNKTSKYKLVHRPILQRKQASTNPSNKIDENLNNHHKTSCSCQKDVRKNAEAQQQAKYYKE
jgi:hypothetical protein